MPDYNVQFVGVYMCMTTTVYGWDLTEAEMLDVEVEELEKAR